MCVFERLPGDFWVLLNLRGYFKIVEGFFQRFDGSRDVSGAALPLTQAAVSIRQRAVGSSATQDIHVNIWSGTVCLSHVMSRQKPAEPGQWR